MAQVAGVDPGFVSLLAIAFVAFRVLHGIFYVTGWHYLRSAAWVGGYLCVLALMGNAAMAI
jgi:uncharacterized MAPEG superfamily protein